MKKTARRYDIVKYCDETQATEAEEEDEHENPNYHLGCMFSTCSSMSPLQTHPTVLLKKYSGKPTWAEGTMF